MSKYEPLKDYLLAQSAASITLTFAQIEAMVKLPAPAKRYAFWWSNEDAQRTMHAQCKAWGEAGYEAEPNLRGKRVTFRRKAA